MKTQIQVSCPGCHSTSVKKNSKKSYDKQNYQYKDCKSQFIGDQALTYYGCHSAIKSCIQLMLVRGYNIRDTAEIATMRLCAQVRY